MIKGYLGLAYHMMDINDGDYVTLEKALYDEFGIDIETFELVAKKLLPYTQREHVSFSHLNVKKYSIPTNSGMFDFIVEYDYV